MQTLYKRGGMRCREPMLDASVAAIEGGLHAATIQAFFFLRESDCARAVEIMSSSTCNTGACIYVVALMKEVVVAQLLLPNGRLNWSRKRQGL